MCTVRVSISLQMAPRTPLYFRRILRLTLFVPAELPTVSITWLEFFGIADLYRCALHNCCLETDELMMNKKIALVRKILTQVQPKT